MITIVWEYQVKADRIAEFEKIYSSDGTWAELFKKGRGFIGTKLVHSGIYPRLYTTLDQWESMQDYKAFLSQWKKEYDALDKQSEDLTEQESCLGTFGVGFNNNE